MGEHTGKPSLKFHDLGGFPPIFGSTPKWRPTDCDVPDGCEELDGNPSSGHVLTGEILAEHDGDEVGVV